MAEKIYSGVCADNHVHAYAPLDQGLRRLETLGAQGVTDANLLAYTYIETGIDNNLISLYYKEKCNDIKLRVFGGLYYDADLNSSTMPYLRQAELLLDMGCDGIKFLDMKPNYNLHCGISMDNMVYDDMYDMLERRQIPLVAHIADPANFWHREQMTEYAIKVGWCYEDPKFLTQQQIFDCLLRRLEKNPNIKLTIAHFGFMSQNMELVSRILETYPNVRFDLTPGWEIYVDFAKDISAWREFFTRYNDRILYGTDTNTNCPDEYIAALHQTMIQFVSRGADEFPMPHYPVANMRGLNLPDDMRKRICHDNYFDFVGNTPKRLDKRLFREHAELIDSIAAKNGDEAMQSAIKQMLQTL